MMNLFLAILCFALNLSLAGLAIKAGIDKRDIDQPWYYMLITCYVIQTLGNFLGEFN